MVKHLVTIVKPATLLRWIREERRGWKPAQRGRPKTRVDIRELVLMFAAENGWCYTRILGELKKLGITSVSKNTVKRILRAAGYDTGPKRGWGSWDEFLKRHAVSLWQCDFLSRRVVTWAGIRDAFVMVFIHVKTRQVIVSPATLKPNDAWVAEQIERFVQQARSRGLRLRMIQHDSDGKFGPGFRTVLNRLRVQRIRNQFRAPNLNACVERVIQTIQHECLDQFIILGTEHLDHLCSEYLAYYHEDRPHQSLDNKTIRNRRRVPATDAVPLKTVRCRQRLGGLLKSYSRKVA
jgi:putative transposase